MKRLIFAITIGTAIIAAVGCSPKSSSSVAAIPDACVGLKGTGASPFRNGYTYNDPPISALIGNGNYIIVGYGVSPGGTCMLTVHVQGTYQGSSYDKTVEIVGTK